MPLSFLYPFLHFSQIGILIPGLEAWHPLQVVGVIALLMHAGRKSEFRRLDALSHPAVKWLAAFLLIQVVSVYRTGGAGMLAEAEYWIVYLGYVVVSIVLIRDEKSLSRYVWGAICGGMVVVGYGICAVILEWPSAVGGRAGAYGMYENHNDYSFLIIQLLPFIYLYRRDASGWLQRLCLGAALSACLVGIFLSLSRGGVLALVLEAALIVIVTMDRRRRMLALPLVAMVGALAIGYQWVKRAENQGDSYTAADAESSRVELWKAAQAMILDRPILGVGSRTFGEHAQEYGEISGDNRGKNAHNTYLEVAATSGVLGLLAFYKMLRHLMRAMRQRAPEGTRGAIPATAAAAMIGLWAILFRALFDAKAHDWSFYFLLVTGLATFFLWRARQGLSEDPVTPGGVSRPGRRASRPAIRDEMSRSRAHVEVTGAGVGPSAGGIRRD